MSRKPIFRAERLPVLQNRVFRTPEEALACPTGDIILVQDEHTGLIFNEAFDPTKLSYDQNYQNEQAYSSVFKFHLDDVTRVIQRHLSGKTLIEVGCGKGHFLEHLQNMGFRVTGVDPAYEGADSRVVKENFTKNLGLSAEGIVLRHVLEHIPDPISFLSDIAKANDGTGAIYIEVPCFNWICRHRAWFDIFYEHVNYFRLQDFSRMFGKIHESGHLFGGQYLYVLADLASLRMPVSLNETPVELPNDFLGGFKRVLATIGKAPDKRNAIWGGASKGVIFSIYIQRAGYTIDEIIDINPAKQGRYIGGTGIKVSSPRDALGRLAPGDNIFVMNSNYLQEIVAQSGNRYSYISVDNERI